MTAHGPEQSADERAAAPYVGDAPVNDEVKTLFSKQAGLQTVRGLGIAMVIVHHMTGKLTNAASVFDAFFVISGYLISMRLIVLAQTASLKDYFITFYTFRVRRIFPVALIVLALTVIVAHLIYLPNRAHDATNDVWWATFFAANVHYAQEGTNYFQQGGVISPVLNFWSLSVEEQFYLAWPIVILIATWVAARRGRGTGVTPVAMTIIVVSFVYGWWVSATHPVSAYYNTFARVWDFGIGALMGNLAVTIAQNSSIAKAKSTGTHSRNAPLFVRINRAMLPWATQIFWVGIVLFLLAMFFTPPVGYPVPGAVFGMVGMGIIFYANTLKRDPSKLFAKATPLIWLGDMSYSLYVVHFPIIVFASAYITGSQTLLFSFDLAASLAVTVLLYNFIEVPFRKPWGHMKAWLRAGGHHKPLMQSAVFAAIAAVLYAVAATPQTAAPVLAGATTTVNPNSSPSSAPGDVASPTPTAPHPVRPGPLTIPEEYAGQVPSGLADIAAKLPTSFTDSHLVGATPQLTNAIIAAIRLTTWPHLTNLQRVDRLDFDEACNAKDPASPPCVARPTSGTDPAKVAVAIGDSTMLSYWPMLRDALVPRGWTVVMYGLASCPAALVNSASPEADPEECTAHHDSYRTLFSTWRPTLVFMSDAESTPFTARSTESGADTTGASTTEIYAKALRAAVVLAQSATKNVVLLSPGPVRKPISTCHVAGSSPTDCLGPVTGLWPTLSSIDQSVAAATGARYADLLPFFCHDLVCPSIVGNLIVGSDYIHITPEYAAMLAPSFAQYLSTTGLTR